MGFIGEAIVLGLQRCPLLEVPSSVSAIFDVAIQQQALNSHALRHSIPP